VRYSFRHERVQHHHAHPGHPETVWAILTDASSYAHWNPEIKRLDGTVARGNKIKAHVILHGGKSQPVSSASLPSTRRAPWSGPAASPSASSPAGAPSPSPRAAMGGEVEFTLNIKFTGPLSDPIANSLGDRQPDIDAFAAGLKAYAERK